MPDRDRSPLGGCLTLAATALGASALLVANGVVVGMLYSQLSPGGPQWLQHPKVGQLLMFTLPVALLIAQWWLLDWLAERVRS